jgi:hypothetical protein
VYAAVVDAESLNALRRVAGEEAGVPEQLHGRITGEDLPSMRRDASELAAALGIAPPEPGRERDERGRFSRTSSGFNALIRERAGY